MKKIIYLFIVLLGVLVSAACSDNIDNPYAKESSISIVKSNLTFPARAANGIVEFRSQGTVTASSNASWCKTNVVGDTVKVVVEQNNERDGRSTVVTLHNGTDSVSVPLTQAGLVFQLDVSSVSDDTDLAKSFSYAMSCNLDFKVLTAPDWLTVSNTEDSLKISMTANATGHLRSGYIKYNVGASLDSIKVSQYNFDKDIAGSYYLVSTGDNGKMQVLSAVVSNDAISLPELNLNIPASFDGSELAVSIKCGQYLGDIALGGATYYLYSVFGDASGHYYTADNVGGASYTASFQYNDKAGTFAMFKGTFGSRTTEIFYFMACKTKEFKKDNFVGSLLALHSPYLLKMSTSGAKMARMVKKNQLRFVLR